MHDVHESGCSTCHVQIGFELHRDTGEVVVADQQQVRKLVEWPWAGKGTRMQLTLLSPHLRAAGRACGSMHPS